MLSALSFAGLPKQSDVLSAMHLANDYFMQKYSDPGKPTFVKKKRTNNMWPRGVYFEGLCELINNDGQASDLDYHTH